MSTYPDSTHTDGTDRHRRHLDLLEYYDEHEYLDDEDSIEEEDDEIDDELAMVNGGDDIESYNRWFLQQQQIGQERHREELIKQATKRRKRIAEAILSGIHLTTASKKSKNASSIYSILRSPDGTAVLKVPLDSSHVTEDARKEGSNADSTEPYEGKDRLRTVGSRSA